MLGLGAGYSPIRDRSLLIWSAMWTFVALVGFGVAAAIIPNPVFGRGVPPEAFAVVVWLASAPLIGVVMATYFAPHPSVAPGPAGQRQRARERRAVPPSRRNGPGFDRRFRRISGDRLPDVQQDRPAAPGLEWRHERLRPDPAFHRGGLARAPGRNCRVAAATSGSRRRMRCSTASSCPALTRDWPSTHGVCQGRS